MVRKLVENDFWSAKQILVKNGKKSELFVIAWNDEKIVQNDFLIFWSSKENFFFKNK